VGDVASALTTLSDSDFEKNLTVKNQLKILKLLSVVDLGKEVQWCNQIFGSWDSKSMHTSFFKMFNHRLMILSLNIFTVHIIIQEDGWIGKVINRPEGFVASQDML